MKEGYSKPGINALSVYFSIITSLLLCSILTFVCHSYYEDGTDVFFKNACAGAFLSAGVEIPTSFGSQTFYSELLAAMYNKFGGVQWYDLYCLGMNTTALSLLI